MPPDLPDVVADPALVQRIVANLLSNALRYAPGAPPRGHRERARRRGASCGSWTAVPAIPAEDRERVFAPFQRLGDADTTPGVGLGLALARGLAESMGGSVVPEDTPGGGLTMVLTLPASRRSARCRRTPTRRTSRSASPLAALLVRDGSAGDGGGVGSAGWLGSTAGASGIRMVNVAPWPGAVSTLSVAAVRGDQRRDDRQAEAGAAAGPGPRGVGAVEALEHVRGVLGRHARALVGDVEHAEAVRRSRR